MMTYFLTRFYFQRALGFIYLIGFLIAFNQFRALCGEKGVLPMRNFFKNISFWDSPTLFWFNQSNIMIVGLASLGLVLALMAVTGFCDSKGTLFSMGTWFALWLLYLSFVNAGQTFYSFGWETLLLETGFLAIFLGPSNSAPPFLVICLLRWVLFRLMFGAALIKLRGDPCWRELTCMTYHYETQPMPNPLSYFFHQLPLGIHKFSVVFMFAVELVAPFFYFGPLWPRRIAGLLGIVFQGILILSGNLSWLNYITLVLCIPALDDGILPRLAFWTEGMGVTFRGGVTALGWQVYAGLTAVVALLSVKPTVNLLSPRQIMNTSFEPLHLVNTYGAFGSVTRERYEVVIEGSNDGGDWKEYEFKGKPGQVDRLPPVVSPYHLRLDWQMWFAAMSSFRDHPWIISVLGQILQGNKEVLSLLRKVPFDSPPTFVRASLYKYNFSKPGEKDWWVRHYEGEYFPMVSLENPQFKAILIEEGWWFKDE